MTEQYYTIRASFTYDSLFDNCDSGELAGIDQPASMDRYEMLVTKAIEAAYPGSYVNVVRGLGNWVTVQADRGHEVVPFVEDIVGRVYHEWDWLVQTATVPDGQQCPAAGRTARTG